MRNLFTLLFCCLALVSRAATEITPPYVQNFDTPASLSDFILLDANGDDECWRYNPMQHYVQCPPCNDGPVDDWLILPLALEANAAYEVSFNCYASLYPERLGLYLGTSATAEGMTQELVAPFEFKTEYERDKLRTKFKVKETGTYYLGFHGCSDREKLYLYLDNLEITVAAVTTPSAPTDLVATPGEKGKTTCDLSFFVPTTTLAGAPLQYVESVRIYRNDNLVRTLTQNANGEDIAPGMELTFNDKELSNRLYTYKVAAVDINGEEGDPAVAEVYVGIDRPGRVLNLTCREDLDRPGTIVLTWEAPKVGIHGGYLDPKQVSYTITSDREVTTYDTHFEDQVNISMGQTYKAYSVYAQNQVGSNKSDWQTVSTQVGPAKVAPWNENYANATVKNGPWLTHVTGSTSIGEASWWTSSAFDEVPDQDGNNGYTHFFTSALGKSARYISPKIDLRQLSAPTLSFWLYLSGKADLVDVDIMPEMTEWETLTTIDLSQGKGWQRYTVDLSRFKDKQFVQIGLNGKSVVETTRITMVDNISVTDNVESDVAIISTNFPIRVNMGQEASFPLTLRNRGSKALAKGDYTLQLYRTEGEDTRLVQSIEGPAIGLDANVEVTLKDTPDVFVPHVVSYYAQAVLEGDAREEDNTSESQRTTVFMPNYPVPTALAATNGTSSVTLGWQAPDMTAGGALPTTDSFEYYPEFSITNCGDWTLYDGDGQYTLTMAMSIGSSVVVLDEYPNAGLPMAWQVYHSADAGIPYGSWEPHSGEMMMVAMGNARNADGQYYDNNDWLISPTLSGKEQKISFFAKCGMSSAYQPELLDVLYTTEELSATDVTAGFRSALTAPIELRNVNEWDEFIVALPEGARHFALRCMSQHKFALLVDDVTYQPEGPANLQLLGYNIYRNRERLNDTPLATPAYLDESVEMEHRYDYYVSAVYDAGESCLSERCKVMRYTDGIQAPTLGTAAAPTYDLQGRRQLRQPQRGLYLQEGHKRLAR